MKAKGNQRLEKPKRQDFVQTEVKARLIKCSYIGEEFFDAFRFVGEFFKERSLCIVVAGRCFAFLEDFYVLEQK